MLALQGGGSVSWQTADLLHFYDRLQGEPHATAVAVVVLAHHSLPSGAPPVQPSPAWGDDWSLSSATANGWAGLSYARRIVRVNEHEFALPDRSHTLVVMADREEAVATRVVTVPRMIAGHFVERWVPARVLVGLFRSAFGGPGYRSRTAAWAEDVCALPAVVQFLEEHAARAR